MNNYRAELKYRVERLAKEFDFETVSYGVDNIPSLGGPEINPSSSLCNEVAATFSVDTRIGYKKLIKKDSWTFELNLSFTNEVILEAFEDSLNDPVLTVDLWGTFDIPPEQKPLDIAEVLMLDKHVEHPVKHGANTGTKVRYNFNANILGK